MRKFVKYGAVALLASAPMLAKAVGTADADVTGAMDDFVATFNAVKTPALVIFGALIGIPILRVVLRKFAR